MALSNVLDLCVCDMYTFLSLCLERAQRLASGTFLSFSQSCILRQSLPALLIISTRQPVSLGTLSLSPQVWITDVGLLFCFSYFLHMDLLPACLSAYLICV